MVDQGYFTKNEKKLLKLLTENPGMGPTEIAKHMGWKHRGTARESKQRLKKKIKNLKDAEEFLRELGISIRQVEDW